MSSARMDENKERKELAFAWTMMEAVFGGRPSPQNDLLVSITSLFATICFYLLASLSSIETKFIPRNMDKLHILGGVQKISLLVVIY